MATDVQPDKQCIACSVPRRAQARGLCVGHYKQWQRGVKKFKPLRTETSRRLGVRFTPRDAERLTKKAQAQGLSFYGLANKVLITAIRRAGERPGPRWKPASVRSGATTGPAMGVRLPPKEFARLGVVAAGHGLSLYAMANELLARGSRKR